MTQSSRRSAGRPPKETATRIADDPIPTRPGKSWRGLDRIRSAAGYSLSGLHVAFVSETAFRQEFFIAVVLLPLAFWVGRNWLEIAVLAGTVFLVLIAELLNSAIEAVVDRVSLDLHELSKRAKDLASAAVFLALLLCSAVWLAAVWKRFNG